MKPRTGAIVAGGIALAILFFSSLYQLSETEQAILTQFGKPVGGLVTSPGLHLKMPFIQTVHRFDKRWLEFDGDPDEIPTKDKKYIWVDTYARWRIVDPLRFFQRLRDESRLGHRIRQCIAGHRRDQRRRPHGYYLRATGQASVGAQRRGYRLACAGRREQQWQLPQRNRKLARYVRRVRSQRERLLR